MICKACGKKIRVTHSYAVPGGRVQRGECAACSKTYTVVSVTTVHEALESGDGAYALAQRIRRGEIALPEVDLD